MKPPPSPPAKTNRSLALLSFIFLALCAWALYQSQWRFPPSAPQGEYSPKLHIMLFNAKLLLHLKGGYATALWGYLAFAGMAGCFYFSGRALLDKILSCRAVQGMEDLSAFSRREIFAVSYLLGTWIWAMVWLALGCLGLLRPAFAYVFLAAGWFLLLYALIRRWKKKEGEKPQPPLKWDAVNLLTAGLYLWLSLWSVLLIFPQSYWDTLMINMALPGFYAAEGKFTPNPFNMYSYFHQNSEILTVWPLLAGSRAAAFMLVWGFFMTLFLCLHGWLSRLTSRMAALLALSLFASSRLAWWLVSFIKNDMQVGIFLILGWWALMESFRKRLSGGAGWRHWLFLSGAGAGIALGHKISGLPAVLVTAAGLSLFFLRQQEETSAGRARAAGKALAIYALGLLFTWWPWLLYDLILTGNPIYPFLNKTLHVAPLYPWQIRLPIQYSVSHMGGAGLWEYFKNMANIHPEGLGKAGIWWGPGIWLSYLGIFALHSSFPRELRWLAGIGIAAWFFSLFFGLKPPLHCGPLIFAACLLCGVVLHALFRRTESKALRRFAAGVVFLDFLHGFAVIHTKELILFPLAIFLSGSSPYQTIAQLPTGDPYAQVDEIEWTNYLINKYTPKEEGVIFVGSLRPAGIRRRHLFGLSLDMQPLLYLAEGSRDTNELKEKLLSRGIRHVVFDPLGWDHWTHNDIMDEPYHHNIPVREEDLAKIREFMARDLVLRFRVPSGRLLWYMIRADPTAAPPPDLVFDRDDLYEFPRHFSELTKDMRGKTSPEVLQKMLEDLASLALLPDILITAYNRLGVLYSDQKDYERAVNAFSRSIAADPKYISAVTNRAIILARAGRPREAAADWTRAIELSPRDPKLYGERARLWLEMGDRSAAAADLARARELLSGR